MNVVPVEVSGVLSVGVADDGDEGVEDGGEVLVEDVVDSSVEVGELSPVWDLEKLFNIFFSFVISTFILKNSKCPPKFLTYFLISVVNHIVTRHEFSNIVPRVVVNDYQLQVTLTN